MKQYLVIQVREFPASGNLPANTSAVLADADGGTRLDRIHLRRFDAEGNPVPASGVKPGTTVQGVLVTTPPFGRTIVQADGKRQPIFETGADGKPILNEEGQPVQVMTKASTALYLI